MGAVLQQADYDLSVGTLCNLDLDRQSVRRGIGDISPQHLYDQRDLLSGFAKHIGGRVSVSNVTTLDL